MTSGYNVGGDGGLINAYYSMDYTTTGAAPIQSWTYSANSYVTSPTINGEDWIYIDNLEPKKVISEWDE